MTQRDPKVLNQQMADSYKQTASKAVEYAEKVAGRGQDSSLLSLLVIECMDKSLEYQKKANES